MKIYRVQLFIHCWNGLRGRGIKEYAKSLLDHNHPRNLKCKLMKKMPFTGTYIKCNFTVEEDRIQYFGAACFSDVKVKEIK